MSGPAPITLDQGQRDALLETFRRGADMAIAAKCVGVSRRTLYRILERDLDLRSQAEDAKAVADDNVVLSLYDAAMAGNHIAAIFWLKNRRPAEWRDRHDIVTEERRSTVRRTIRFGGRTVDPRVTGVPGSDVPLDGDGGHDRERTAVG